MQINDLTAIARPLDPNYLTNRAIVAFTMIVVAGGTIIQLFAGVELIQGALWGIAAGFAVFLAWALGRELDPDHDLSAFVAAGLTLFGLLLFDLPSIVVLFWMLILVRILNRTVGMPATILDSLLVLGLAGWLTLQAGGWVYGLMTALTFFLDSRLSMPHKRHLFFSGIALLVAVISLAFNGDMRVEAELSLSTVLPVTAMSALFVPVIIASHELRAVGDQTSEPLYPRRVQASQVVALLTGVQIALRSGDPGLVSIVPLWAAMLGVSLYRIFVVIYARRPSTLR